MPVIGIILLVVYFALKLFGIGKTKNVYVSFNCLPWQPPSGGANCDKCNGDPFKPCSPYRCKSLGQNCELINQGTDQELCSNNAPKDVSSPKITPLLGTITTGYEYSEIKDNGFNVESSTKDCIPEYTSVNFGIKTESPSQCKISDDPLKTYEDMEDYSGNSDLYLANHTAVLNIPSVEALANQYNLTLEQVKKLGEINFYVKCKGINGKANDASYTIKTCVKPGPDLTSPYIVKTIPETGSYIAYNKTEFDMDLWTNEPASCKWSNKDSSYELMENSMKCFQDFEDAELWGWPCSATLNTEKGNIFYIKCQDLSNNKNNMSESYIYEIKKSESELKIKSQNLS